MKRCIHCETVIDDPNRSMFCTNWCAADYRQPEEHKTLKTQLYSIKDGVYYEEYE